MPDIPLPDLTAVEPHLDVATLLRIVSTLLRCPGQNPPGGEGPTADALAAAAADLGLEVVMDEVEPGRPNVIVTLPGGPGPGLLLLGHTDVVPVGEGWSLDPFGAVLRDGRLFGRGAADMKGGLAACLSAMSGLRRAGVELSGPVVLSAVVDEEETGRGIRHDIVTHDRRGFLGCVVAEPTDLQTIIAARGDSYLEITVGGRAAHSGDPAQGANAIYGAAAVIGAIEAEHTRLASDAHPLVGPATWSVGQIHGGTGTSTVPAEAVIHADRRLLPGEDPDLVEHDTRALVQALDLGARGMRATVTMTMQMPGFETDPQSELVRAAQEALKEAAGQAPPLAGWTAACDGGFIARDCGVPVVVLGPGSVTGQAHQPDESVAVDQLATAARVYASIALLLLGPGSQRA